MKVEHVAFNVVQPVAMAKWWCENLGFRVVRAGGPPAHGHFLADSAGSTVIEIYHNSSAAVPDYAAMALPTLHVAFLCDDPLAMREKLISAGASPLGETIRNDSGDVITEVRDPFGMAIQLVKRGKNLL